MKCCEPKSEKALTKKNTNTCMNLFIFPFPDVCIDWALEQLACTFKLSENMCFVNFMMYYHVGVHGR